LKKKEKKENFEKKKLCFVYLVFSIFKNSNKRFFSCILVLFRFIFSTFFSCFLFKRKKIKKFVNVKFQKKNGQDYWRIFQKFNVLNFQNKKNIVCVCVCVFSRLEQENNFSFFNFLIIVRRRFLVFYDYVGFATRWMVGKGIIYTKLRKEIQRNSGYNLATCFIKTNVWWTTCCFVRTSGWWINVVSLDATHKWLPMPMM